MLGLIAKKIINERLVPRYVAIFLYALGMFSIQGDVIAATSVSGVIGSDARWTKINSPYLVTADVIVQGGATLTVEAGTEVYMGTGTRLTVQAGALKAIGTIQSPIKFTSQKLLDGQTPSPGDWQKITLSTGSTTATKLEYVQIEYGGGLVVGANVSPTFNYVTLKNNKGSAITADLASSINGTGNYAIGNDNNAVVVLAGDISGSASWKMQGIPYLIESGNISVGTAPKIISVSPNNLQQGDIQTVAISGSRLSGFAQAVLNRKAHDRCDALLQARCNLQTARIRDSFDRG